jgi:vacuolar-type H+-ATPase subunit F/Vma7
MTTVRVVATPAAAAGFALAGVPVTQVAEVHAGPAAIAALLDRTDVGVLLVEQGLLDALSDAERHDVMDRPSPVVVPFPGPEWGARLSPAEAYVLELLRRAIGYRVRLR